MLEIGTSSDAVYIAQLVGVKEQLGLEAHVRTIREDDFDRWRPLRDGHQAKPRRTDRTRLLRGAANGYRLKATISVVQTQLMTSDHLQLASRKAAENVPRLILLATDAFVSDRPIFDNRAARSS